MPFVNAAMIQDANDSLPDQYYDIELNKFVLVSVEHPYPIRVFPKHTGFVASQGDWGWYTTQVNDEIITFATPINAIFIDSKDDRLKIKINDCVDFLYLEAFSNIGVEDIAVEKIQVMLPAGALIKYRGLYI